MTEIWALMDRHEEKERRKYIRAGTVAAAIYNVNRDPQKHPQAIGYADIFPQSAVSGQQSAVSEEASGADIDLFFTGIVAKAKREGTVTSILSRRRKVSASTMVG